MNKVTIGRIVEFFPGIKEVSGYELPNSMQSAPAIVTQCFGQHSNLSVLVADPNGSPVFTAWSVTEKVDSVEGGAYWDWPKRDGE